jgi:uncharacterized membrane protein
MLYAVIVFLLIMLIAVMMYHRCMYWQNEYHFARIKREKRLILRKKIKAYQTKATNALEESKLKELTDILKEVMSLSHKRYR